MDDDRILDDFDLEDEELLDDEYELNTYDDLGFIDAELEREMVYEIIRDGSILIGGESL
jgi:hypothetical protein